MDDSKIIGPGFQGSDKSGCEVSIYAHGNDPVFSLDAIKGPVHLKSAVKTFEKPELREDDLLMAVGSSAISSLTWTKSIGQPSGTFSIDVKTRKPEIFLRGLNDDDWIDIVLTQHAKKFHVCRGLIDTIRPSGAVTNGATERTFTLTGRDFGKIFEVTPIFFNLYLGKDVGGGATLDRLASNGALWGDVAKTVEGFLFAFLSTQANVQANARWALPPGIPGLTGSGDSGVPTFFRDKVTFAKDFYSNWPKRKAFHPHMIDPEFWGGHTLWDLAKEWADPFFCEMFLDLVDKDTLLPPVQGQELLPENSIMAVTIRDRPFPTTNARDFAGQPVTINEHPWFVSIPTYTVTRQEIGNDNIGRGGDERYNTFFVKNAATNEYSGQNINLSKPLWYPDDVARRGIRRMEAFSNYHEESSDNDSMITAQREMLRDWYGLNAYFYNGTIPLNHLRPDIRVGTKIRIPGSSPDFDETYYVEGLTHQWRLGQGRTTLTVTRGWRGTDQSLISAINGLASRYELPTSFPDLLGGDGFDPSKVIA